MAQVQFTGIEKNPTLWASGLTRGQDEGKPVKVSANGTVALASGEERFFGVVLSVSEDHQVAVVQTHGFVTVPYTGAAPALGYTELVADGTGGVKVPTTAGTGIPYWVVAVDTANQTVTFLLKS